ncbi:MAG: alpha-2-macroglobulin family protein, partial [Pseudomonadota bacterium]
ARSYKDGMIKPPEGELVTLTITDSRNEVRYSEKHTLGAFGSTSGTFPIKGFFPLGHYTIRADYGADRGKGDQPSRTFLVGEYKVPGHFVNVSLKTEEKTSTEYVTLQRKEEYLVADIKGRYYAGGPLKHGKASWKATLVPAEYKVKDFDGFFFGNQETKELFLESGEAVLDREGNLRLVIPMDGRLLTGLYGVRVSATVLDVDGEPATEVETYKPAPHYSVGISLHPKKVQEGHAATLSVIVVDKNGKKIPTGELNANVLEKRYFYTLKRDEHGNVSYQYEEGWAKNTGARIPIREGKADYDVELGDNRQYMISFTYEDRSGAYTSQTVFEVGWEDYDRWMRERTEKTVPTGQEVLVGLTKNEYAVGDKVGVQFSTKRPVNKCLVTLENAGILDYRIVEVNGRKAALEFTATDKHRPNVYISVMAPAGRAEFPVYRSVADVDMPSLFYGYAEAKIRSEVKGLNVEIDPGNKEMRGRPGERASVSFKVTDRTGKGALCELAVCVVNEAVLALTRFKTPDLSTLADFRLPLSVFSGDLRLALISQDLLRIFSAKPLTGGDGAGGLVAPSVRKRFDPVAYFNPAVLTDESGAASVSFQLPDTTTTYRVYVVACDKGSGFASTQRDMLVVKEFFVEPSLPRFLIPGDKAVFPISLFNKTDGEGKASLRAEGMKGLELKLEGASANVPPMSSSVLNCTLNATGGADKATVLIQGEFSGAGGKFSDAVEKTVPVHSRYLPVNRMYSGSFRDKTEVKVDLPSTLEQLGPDALAREDFKARVTLSTNSWTRMAPGLKYLLRYPYGCVEQTSSGIIPLAGMRALVKSGKIPGIGVDEVDKFLNAGITRLLNMQNSAGGFSYWPGSPQTSWWGTLYASLALTMAEQAGLDVPDENMG